MKKKILIGVLTLFLLALFIIMGKSYYDYNLKSTNPNSKETISLTIKKGSSSKDVAKLLKEKGLIRNEKIFLRYAREKKEDVGIKAGHYIFKKSYDVPHILALLNKGENLKYTRLIFKEGQNMKKIKETIVKNTKIKEEEIDSLLKDQTYLNELINNYWFIDKSILDNRLYYSLEGYLAPNTYFVASNTTLKQIFKMMLDETNKILTKYKNEIEKSKYSVHEILTLASIVELEGNSKETRENVMGVFNNRMKKKIPLGSDVTTYYGSRLGLQERDLNSNELKHNNYYNTREESGNTKLPIGPISSPSEESILAVLRPKENNYLFFVSDKNGKIYFTNNLREHNEKIRELKKRGEWFSYAK